MNSLIIPDSLQTPEPVKQKTRDFFEHFQPHEIKTGAKLLLHFDEKSNAFYITCHLEGSVLSEFCDLDASLDNDEEDEMYKLNREITEDKAAYITMENDALNGRSFEDIVIEFDKTYRSEKPLKIYGGQHRLTAITKAVKTKGNILHGVRIYFELSRDQKVEIATVNNTAIAVPNDLLDRMREQLLGTELRDWCQKAGLLEKNQDFADRRSPETPTVRIIRTLIVNFYLGKEARDIEKFHEPSVCRSGGVDEEYAEARSKINWNDLALLDMGKRFGHLHKLQRQTVLGCKKDANAEFARKALSISVVASWAYAAGLFQSKPSYLDNLYAIPDNIIPPNDPLNARALSGARHKGTDPDTYRGLGTRSTPRELGRMFEVFLVLATKNKKQITAEIANAAIQSYEAKKATHEAQKALGKI
ncbi:hypothetical protein HY732_04230 [Candidatus Uhrbacteria bacterium]|nr:hypothetical protein [Candidatus Uhrbacteria bacterium]